MTHRTAGLLALAGGAMVAIGSLLPWITATSGFGTASVAGTEGDGIITLVVGGGVALVAVLNLDGPASSRVTGLILLGGLAAAVFGIWEITNVMKRLDTDSEYVRASIGIGLYVVVAGGVAAIVGAVRLGKATA